MTFTEENVETVDFSKFKPDTVTNQTNLDESSNDAEQRPLRTTLDIINAATGTAALPSFFNGSTNSIEEESTGTIPLGGFRSFAANFEGENTDFPVNFADPRSMSEVNEAASAGPGGKTRKSGRKSALNMTNDSLRTTISPTSGAISGQGNRISTLSEQTAAAPSIVLHSASDAKPIKKRPSRSPNSSPRAHSPSGSTRSPARSPREAIMDQVRNTLNNFDETAVAVSAGSEGFGAAVGVEVRGMSLLNASSTGPSHDAGGMFDSFAQNQKSSLKDTLDSTMNAPLTSFISNKSDGESSDVFASMSGQTAVAGAVSRETSVKSLKSPQNTVSGQFSIFDISADTPDVFLQPTGDARKAPALTRRERQFFNADGSLRPTKVVRKKLYYTARGEPVSCPPDVVKKKITDMSSEGGPKAVSKMGSTVSLSDSLSNPPPPAIVLDSDNENSPCTASPNASVVGQKSSSNNPSVVAAVSSFKRKRGSSMLYFDDEGKPQNSQYVVLHMDVKKLTMADNVPKNTARDRANKRKARRDKMLAKL